MKKKKEPKYIINSSAELIGFVDAIKEGNLYFKSVCRVANERRCRVEDVDPEIYHRIEDNNEKSAAVFSYMRG